MIFLKSDFTYNVIIPLVSAFIGGFISLWLFKKGIEKQKQAEKEKRIQNNFETEEYFKINLESILIFIDHQINEISFVSKKTKNWNAKNLTLAISKARINSRAPNRQTPSDKRTSLFKGSSRPTGFFTALNPSTTSSSTVKNVRAKMIHTSICLKRLDNHKLVPINIFF